MKNIFLLPTPKPSRLYKNGNFLLLDSKEMPDNTLETKNQHLSVTSDEEIKEGSYVIKNGQVFKVDSNNAYSGTFNITLKYAKKYLKKIILTTDPDLIKDGVQAIPDEFLEWFVKNPSCEYVKIERLLKIGDLTQLGEIFDITESWKFNGRTLYYCGKSKTEGIWKLEEELIINNFNNTYKIIIPKEEQNTMKNIHIIPTDKPSRLYDDGLELYLLIKASNSNNDLISYKNIYITSDEEIKEGDYMLLKYEHSHGRIRKCHYIYEEQLMIDAKEDIGFGFCKRNEVYKIILTTDQDLIKDGIQAISTEFLEWFVKNPSCEEVEVMNVPDFIYETKHSCYKIIIPKEEPCTCTDECLGYLTKTCKRIEEEPKQELKIGDNTNFGIITDIKEYSVCFGKNKIGVDIWYKKSDVKLEPKKETLEEAVNNFKKTDVYINEIKQAQERSYSEEEVKNIISKLIRDCYYMQEPNQDVAEWFEQFKK